MSITNFSAQTAMHDRFRGFLPIIIDVETSGLDPMRNAILEVAAVLIERNAEGFFELGTAHFEHVLPFEGAELDEASLAFNGIDPFQPLRFALSEQDALHNLFKPVRAALKRHKCQKAVLVGHNAWFDLLFLKHACERTGIKNPFHPFTAFDTATLGGVLYGQTVLAKAAHQAKIPFDAKQAHSALYDAQKTAELFCTILNTLDSCQTQYL